MQPVVILDDNVQHTPAGGLGGPQAPPQLPADFEIAPPERRAALEQRLEAIDAALDQRIEETVQAGVRTLGQRGIDFDETSRRLRRHTARLRSDKAPLAPFLETVMTLAMQIRLEIADSTNDYWDCIIAAVTTAAAAATAAGGGGGDGGSNTDEIERIETQLKEFIDHRTERRCRNSIRFVISKYFSNNYFALCSDDYTMLLQLRLPSLLTSCFGTDRRNGVIAVAARGGGGGGGGGGGAGGAGALRAPPTPPAVIVAAAAAAARAAGRDISVIVQSLKRQR